MFYLGNIKDVNLLAKTVETFDGEKIHGCSTQCSFRNHNQQVSNLGSKLKSLTEELLPQWIPSLISNYLFQSKFKIYLLW